MNNISKKDDRDLNNKGLSAYSWLGYGAQIIALFLALEILAGRVYEYSYWAFFGLSTELIDTNFINYAVMSPNVAVASVIIAIVSILIITSLRRRIPDFIGENNPQNVFYFGIGLICLGFVVISIVLVCNTSVWASGIAGLLYGFGYFGIFAGLFVVLEVESRKDDKNLYKQQKPESIISRIQRIIPRALILVFCVVCMVFASFASILLAAHNFGTNEARFTHERRPISIVYLDSAYGFENMPIISTPNGELFMETKIIIETGGFLYVSTNIKADSEKLSILAIPLSRIRSINYEVEIPSIIW